MLYVCKLIPIEVGEGYGHHRECYQHFMKHVHWLKDPAVDKSHQLHHSFDKEYKDVDLLPKGS